MNYISGVWLLLLTSVCWNGFASSCGILEEGEPFSVVCRSLLDDGSGNSASDATKFYTLAIRISPSPFRLLTLCYVSSQNCQDFEEDKFQSKLSIENSTNEYSLTLAVTSANREETDFYCQRDGTTYGVCKMEIFVKPDQPRCENPEFTEDGTTIIWKCTTDNIYPSAQCHFSIQGRQQENGNGSEIIKLDSPSSGYPGSKKMECTLRVPVRRLPEGDNNFKSSVRLELSAVKEEDHVVYGSSAPIVTLRSVSLRNPNDNDKTYQVQQGKDLSLSIYIYGSPPPNRFSLSMRRSANDDDTELAIAKSHYDVSYGQNHLKVVIKDIRDDHSPFGKYTLHASNSVSNSQEQLKFKFTIQEAAKDDSSSGDSNVPLIAGIAGGSLIIIIGVVVALVCFCKKKREPEPPQEIQLPDFDAPYIDTFGYPNAGFQHDYDQPDGGLQKPPPYSSERGRPEHDYASMGGYYSEIDTDIERYADTSTDIRGPPRPHVVTNDDRKYH